MLKSQFVYMCLFIFPENIIVPSDIFWGNKKGKLAEAVVRKCSSKWMF